MPVILGRRGFNNLCRSVVEVLYYGDLTKVGRKRKEKTSDILEELLGDLSRDTDEVILHMVAQVAMWWYASLYEMVITALPSSSAKTIWNEDRVMEECEKVRD